MSMENGNEQWATVDLMGHAQTAGRIEMAGGLLRVDVPDGEAYRTEYYGLAAIYSVKFVSEEIARAYAHRQVDVMAYDVPIVTREQHQAAVRQIEEKAYGLARKVQELERRLTAVNALPAPDDGLETCEHGCRRGECYVEVCSYNRHGGDDE